MSNTGDHAERMNQVYRFQRYIYNLSRPFFLLDRNTLLRGLRVTAGQRVLEVGCGTARNLIWLAKREPNARFFGIDASSEMLKSAARYVERACLSDRITLCEGLGENASAEWFPPRGEKFDIVVFSYALSMIDDPRSALGAALDVLRPGGQIAIVDFGDQSDLPQWWRKLLSKFLAHFHVRCMKDQIALLEELSCGPRGKLDLRFRRRGFSYLARFTTSYVASSAATL